MEFLRSILSSMKDSQEKINVLDNVARKQTNLDSMKQYSVMEYNLAEKLRDSSHMAIALDRLGWCNALQGDLSKSFRWYSESYDLFQKMGDEVGVGKSISGMADAMLGMGNFEKGIQMKNHALNIFQLNNEREMMGIIYRSLGNACFDYMQYKMAMEKYMCALQIDKELKIERNIGRDLHTLGKTSYEDCGKLTIQKFQNLKDTLLMALELHKKTEDYLYEIHTCMTLAMLYSDMVILSNNWNYADSSMYYTQMGKHHVEKTGYIRLKNNYELLHARHLILAGENGEALRILNKYSRDTARQKDLNTILYRTYDFFYHYNNDYRGIFDNKYRAELNRKKFYISEFHAKVSKLSTESECEAYIMEMEKRDEQRTRDFNRQQEIHQNFVIFGQILVGLILIIIVVLTIIYLHDRKISQDLKRQQEDISLANEKLSLLIIQTSEQSLEIAQQTSEMKRQRNKLASYNLRIVLNLEIGRRIQRCVIPTEEYMRNIFSSIVILWRPLEEVSGDFYWGARIGSLRILAAADCTGHGIPGAFLSMLGVALLNSIVHRMGQNITAAMVLNSLRRRVEELMRRGASNNDVHDGMDIAVCVFDSSKRKMTFAGAYRPLWMVRDGKITEYKGDKMPVAVDDDRTGDFTNHEIETRKGDRFYMFSDGITDQYGMRPDGKNSKFKSKRLAELIERIHLHHPTRQMVELENSIDQWRGIHEQTDDILLVGVSEE